MSMLLHLFQALERKTEDLKPHLIEFLVNQCLGEKKGRTWQMGELPVVKSLEAGGSAPSTPSTFGKVVTIAT